MLIGIDIGNTDFTIGIFQGSKLLDTFRMRSKSKKTSDEYGMFMLDVIKYRGYSVEDVEDVIIASVVPNVMHSFTSAIIKYLDLRPIIVGPGIKTGIKIMTNNPKETGADRIVDAVAAYEIYKRPVIVIDFGTATTYDVINEKGEFIGGVITPGLGTAVKMLGQQAAKLPEIEIRKPNHIIGKDTVSAMQAGCVYGYIGQTEYIIRKLKEESGYKDAFVVATGGLGRMISEETNTIDEYDQYLTLKGLQIIYEKQK
ncbi:MAG: type III pantothenate kinase [Eubacteriales bacterium]|nr:type III pantothenate kinase [Eubacteriales bacterium]